MDMTNLSPLQRERLFFRPFLPVILEDFSSLATIKEEKTARLNSQLSSLFPHTADQKPLSFKKGKKSESKPLIVGVVLSGGQAPGGHTVISGLFDALKKAHPESRLIGFCDGMSGVIKNKTREITDELLSSYRNQGGFNMIGSGRTKIETQEQFVAVEKTVKDLALDGLVIIGGDDSNTNAAFLAEYFIKQNSPTRVIGVPKTIDGDLKNEFIEVSFGFDTACKIYSEIIGNICMDALSAKKYYHFIKLMGRSASHITLECALKTHPNLAIMGEEIAAEEKSLAQLVQEIANLIVSRAEQGKNFGVILIPEGVIEFIPDFKQMLRELNARLSSDQLHLKKLESFESIYDKTSYMAQQLSEASQRCYSSLPVMIQEQLLLDRDPHGNVQVSKIETDKLLISLVEVELKKRQQEGRYKGKFTPQPLFCGYEGRSGLPSNFDCHYCYSLGYLAALLIEKEATGYMACIKNLTAPVKDWQIAGIPLAQMIHLEERDGKTKAVIRKALVDLQGPVFESFKQQREGWFLEDDYSSPGPIQFSGSAEMTDSPPLSLQLERAHLSSRIEAYSLK
jgi:diphosphate-dependent phosphofructokinase